MEKGFSVDETSTATALEQGILDTNKILTRNSEVLLTAHSHIRLSTTFRWNTHPKTGERFTGSIAYHSNFTDEGLNEHNNWHYHLMPGLEAIYGYNMTNVQVFDLKLNKATSLFDKSVLIKTLYYPSYSSDTLHNVPIMRNYFLASVYDEDSNKDGFINLKDLRRIYYFSLDASTRTALLPAHYSVYKSQYDAGNDYLYLHAYEDQNANGIIDLDEPSHCFYVNLQQPGLGVKMF
jgi:hypothetical protein